jgi:tetratricopeptide (TPR) repeat protein
LALSYQALKKSDEFASLWDKWQRRSDRIAKLQPPRRGGKAKGGVAVVNCHNRSAPSGASASTALRYGWCFMGINRAMEAAKSFEIAIAGQSSRTSGEAVYGKTLAYLRIGLLDEASHTATRAHLEKGRANELQVAILTQRATSAFDIGRYREAILYLDQRAGLKREPSDLMLMRGHAYLKLNRAREAMQIFEALAVTGNRDAIRSMRLMLSER